MSAKMPLAETEIVKRAELGGGVAILTVRRTSAFLLRPFATFAITPTSRYAESLTDATCVSVALHQHEQMVRQLAAHAGPTGEDAA